MEFIALNMPAFAIFTVRIGLAVLFFSQAYDKIFTVGLKEFTRTVDQGVKASKLPDFFVRVSTFISSYIELIGSLLLILGLFLPIVYFALAFNLIMVIISFSYLQPMWDMKHVFPRLVMLIFLMIMPAGADLFTLSSIL